MTNQAQDVVNLVSLIIGVMNLEENLTQGDKQDIMKQFDNNAQLLLNSIDSHLQEQDRQIKELKLQVEEIISLLK